MAAFCRISSRAVLTGLSSSVPSDNPALLHLSQIFTSSAATALLPYFYLQITPSSRPEGQITYFPSDHKHSYWCWPWLLWTKTRNSHTSMQEVQFWLHKRAKLKSILRNTRNQLSLFLLSKGKCSYLLCITLIFHFSVECNIQISLQ